MSGRAVAVLALVLVLTGSVAGADQISASNYWPYDGVWFHLVPDSDFGYGPFNAGDIFVYCGYACEEWSQRNITQEGWYHDPVSHNNYHQTPEWFGDMVYCCSETANWWNYFGGNLHAAWDCGDVRSDINQEYVDWGVYADGGYMPVCGIGGSGLQTGPGYGAFPFSVLNTGDYSWAVIRNDYLYGFLPNVQNSAGYNISVTSAYRNPVRNGAVGGAYLSRHQWGDAADFKPWFTGSGCVDSGNWEWLSEVAQGQGASYIEPYSLDCSHLHADLRNW